MGIQRKKLVEQMADLVSDREVCNKPKVVEILLTGKFEIKCKVVEI